MSNESPVSLPRLKLAVWKFASCDGCQLSLLDCEEALLGLAARIDIAHFPEATSRSAPGPYDVSLVEGSITTERDQKRIQRIREQSRLLVAIGACATSGGVQALKNFFPQGDFVRVVYPKPEEIDTLSTSTPIAQHVKVDYELRGCPVGKHQLLALLASIAAGLNPRQSTGSVCQDCKRAGYPCVMVSASEPCLGPATQTGCGAICPRFGRGCYGCFGPMDSSRPLAMAQTLQDLGLSARQRHDLFQSFNAASAPFRLAVQSDDA